MKSKKFTDEEKAMLDDLEKKYEEADEVAKKEKVSLVMCEILSKIRKGKLYRETHNTFKDFAFERFNITRNYAQNSAQVGDYLSVLREKFIIAETFSVNTIQAMAVGTNKVAEEIGIKKKSDFTSMRPIIENITTILIDISTEKDEKIVIKPDIVKKVYEMVANIIKSETVTIEGVKVKVWEAKEKCLVDNSLHKKIISQLAEQILAKLEIIKNEFGER